MRKTAWIAFNFSKTYTYNLVWERLDNIFPLCTLLLLFILKYDLYVPTHIISYILIQFTTVYLWFINFISIFPLFCNMTVSAYFFIHLHIMRKNNKWVAKIFYTLQNYAVCCTEWDYAFINALLSETHAKFNKTWFLTITPIQVG
jgi:hypothetical protein